MGALALTNTLTIFADPVRRNVLLLAICQAVSNSGTSMLAAVAALVGYSLVDDKSFATLPLAIQWTATMATTIPAAQLMRRFGRRAGLSLGAIIFMTGGVLGFWSIWIANFYVFIAACVCIGSAMSFVHYYRFAAADSAPEDFKSKAISLVLAGGVVAAVMGGELAKLSVDWFEPLLYAGCYAAIVLLGLAVLIILQGVRIPTLTAEQRRTSGRPLLTIARQPVFIVAVAASALSYAAMIMIMTATPLAMQACGFEFHDTATVIQWHVLAMYLPSFFTGSLIARFGVLRIIAVGGILVSASLATNISGIAFLNFWGGLVLMGLGWNFMFVGGSTLLTKAYTVEERAKVQGINDFIVFSTTAAAAFSSGALQGEFGWSAVNTGAIPAMCIALLGVAWMALRRRAATAA